MSYRDSILKGNKGDIILLGIQYSIWIKKYNSQQIGNVIYHSIIYSFILTELYAVHNLFDHQIQAIYNMQDIVSQRQHSFEDLLNEIREELNTNQTIYSRFMNTDQIRQAIDEFSQRYRTHSEAKKFLNLLMDFLSFGKNKCGFIPYLETDLSEKFQQEWILRWNRIKHPSFKYNAGHLKLLNYIVAKPPIGELEFSHFFQDLKFDLSLEQGRGVAEITKKMMREDIRAFCFMSNYLYSCCIKLDKDNQPMQNIRQKYQELLVKLHQENRAAPKIQASEEELNVHPNFKDEEIMLNLPYYDPNQFKTIIEKQEQLEQFIMNRAQDASRYKDSFDGVIKAICDNNGGIYFKSGVKIKCRSQKKALVRIKEKMLWKHYSETKVQRKLSSFIKKSNLNSKFIDIYTYTAQEHAQYQQKMQKIFESINKPIRFNITDLLRGKCVFSSVERINKCCQDIKSEIEKRGIKLIQIDNRLLKENSDIVMKILFGTTIAELQLVKDLDPINYQFHHKLYELKRSKFFTPLTNLSILNEEISEDYFTEVRAIILKNINCTDYMEKVTYSDCMENFRKFTKKLDININFLKPHINSIDIKKMGEEKQRLSKIKATESPEKQTKFNSVEIIFNQCYQLYLKKDHLSALLNSKQSIQTFKKKQEKLMEKTRRQEKIDVVQQKKMQLYLQNTRIAGLNNSELGRYEEALALYQQCQQFLKIVGGNKEINMAIILNDIGSVYDRLGRHHQALDSYYKSLQIQNNSEQKRMLDIATTKCNIGSAYTHLQRYAEALKEFYQCLDIQLRQRDTEGTATTINNIASVYNLMGNYGQALNSYRKSLQIVEKIRGAATYETAITLSNIGLVLKNQGKYEEALQKLEESLKIEKRIKGEDSFGTAGILNNVGSIHDIQGQYQEALKCYKQCLQIQETVDKQSFDKAITLNNIGATFKNMKRYEQALKNYEQSLRIKIKIKGENSIDTANTINNIGLINMYLRRHKLALQNYRRCLKIQENSLQSFSLEKVATLRNIGALYYIKGVHSEAIVYYKRALSIYDQLNIKNQQYASLKMMLETAKEKEKGRKALNSKP